MLTLGSPAARLLCWRWLLPTSTWNPSWSLAIARRRRWLLVLRPRGCLLVCCVLACFTTRSSPRRPRLCPPRASRLLHHAGTWPLLTESEKHKLNPAFYRWHAAATCGRGTGFQFDDISVILPNDELVTVPGVFPLRSVIGFILRRLRFSLAVLLAMVAVVSCSLRSWREAARSDFDAVAKCSSEFARHFVISPLSRAFHALVASAFVRPSLVRACATRSDALNSVEVALECYVCELCMCSFSSKQQLSVHRHSSHG